MAYTKVRIQQKFDTLENWNKNSLTLLNGELAVVVCGNAIRFKIGNGISSFTQLPFVDENVLSTKVLHAQSIDQGLNNIISQYGSAGGAYLSVDANFSQALGVNARVKIADAFSFVYNGNDTGNIGENPYVSHGKGSFNVNPLEGANGFYVGEQNLCSIFQQESDALCLQISATSCDLSTKIEDLSGYVDGLEVSIYGGDKNRDVLYLIPLYRFKDSINKINEQIGHALLSDDSQMEDVKANVVDFYFYYEMEPPTITTVSSLFRSLNDLVLSTDLSSDYNFTIKEALKDVNVDFCQLDMRVVNLCANFRELSAAFPSKVSQLWNDIGYLTNLSSQEMHYLKNETSSNAELFDAFNSIDLSNVYKKSETSSALEIQTNLEQRNISVDNNINYLSSSLSSDDVYLSSEISSNDNDIYYLSSELSTKTISSEVRTLADQQIELFRAAFNSIAPLSADSSIQEIANTVNSLIAALRQATT